jgi:hypothetical protein
MSNKIKVAKFIGYTAGILFRMSVFVGCVYASIQVINWLGV